MTENSSYRGGQGQGRPGDDYYDDRYGTRKTTRAVARIPAALIRRNLAATPTSADIQTSGATPTSADIQTSGATPTSADIQTSGATPTSADIQTSGATPTKAATHRNMNSDRPAATVAAQAMRRAIGRVTITANPPAKVTASMPTTVAGRRATRTATASLTQRSPYPDQAGGYDQGYPGGPGYGQQDYGQQSDYPRYSAPAGAPAAPTARTPSRRRAITTMVSRQTPQLWRYGAYEQGGYAPSGTAVTLQLDDGSGRTYQLREGPNVVGRGQDAQFRLPDTGVSRRHLEIRWDGQVALLSDLNSTNGTTVNNAPVQEWQLADGDVIRLGHSEIVVRIH